LEALIEDCGRVELRRIVGSHKQNRFRWFDDPEALWEQARQWAGDGVSLFTSLNQPVADHPRNHGLKDAGVSRYRRLLFDFDPLREKGSNSTDDEVRAALAMRDDFVQRMHAMGWPEPILAMSGNGAHAQYRVDIDSARRVELREFYRGLGSRLRGAGINFDRTTFNPSRLCRLYGTLNRKGPDDGHRRQSTCEVPPDFRVVPERALQLAMDAYRIEPPKLVARPVESRKLRSGGGDYRTLDVVAWFQAWGLYRFPMSGGKHSIICPWAGSEHDISNDSDTVVWETSSTGYPQFHCLHNHCANRWMLDVIEKLGNAADFCRGVRS
jgi:hypothetical protein